MKIKSFIFICSLILTPLCAMAGKVTAILDGDTLEIMESGKAVRVRLANIDAPEKSQPYGQASKKSLSDLCYGQEAQLRIQNNDQYGRVVGVVICAGVEVNKAQVERGLAWVYTTYNRDPALVPLQNTARNASHGLWRDASPIPPWEYRHGPQNQLGTSTTCYTGPLGGRYRLVNGHKQYGC